MLSHIEFVENCNAPDVVRSGSTLKSMTVTMMWLLMTWSYLFDNLSKAGTCYYCSSENSYWDHATLPLITGGGNESNLSFFLLTCLFDSLAKILSIQLKAKRGWT